MQQPDSPINLYALFQELTCSIVPWTPQERLLHCRNQAAAQRSTQVFLSAKQQCAGTISLKGVVMTCSSKRRACSTQVLIYHRMQRPGLRGYTHTVYPQACLRWLESRGARIFQAHVGSPGLIDQHPQDRLTQISQHSEGGAAIN